MSAMDFPNEPDEDDIYTNGIYTWQYDGTRWNRYLGSLDVFTQAQTIETKSDSYTLVNSDVGKVIAMNKSTAQTVTINGSLDLSVGQRIDVVQTGAGQVTFSASSATVNGTPGLKTRAQYSAATVLCTGTDTYIVIGDLAA